MKKISAIISLCLACVAAFAQTADIEVSYNYRHFHRRGSEQNHQMILLANASHSKFYNPITDYLDSLESTPEGTDAYNQMKMAAFSSGNMKDVPKRSVPMYVFKHKDGVFDVYDGNIASMYHYTEPYEIQEWTVCDSTKNILGYDCIMATADYHGRHWSVWFTPDIPIQDGPWKLSGLPGLILEASESSEQHRFTATGISTTTRQITPNRGAGHYDNTDRISMLKTLRRFEDNPEAGLSAALGISVKIKKGDVTFDKSLDFLETNYK